VRVPDDRRVVLVRPTATGLALVDEAEFVRSDVIRAALERMSTEALEQLATATAGLRIAVEAELASAPDRYATPMSCSHDHVNSGEPSAASPGDVPAGS
ncbi:MAG: MarR family winged helix-turn-helix transcriptional regulator, partial [Chloroflexi bacterium]|nr:MarR family winged helix-turn-helix transcriptional regulator [Chloroflexota bacterium]